MARGSNRTADPAPGGGVLGPLFELAKLCEAARDTITFPAITLPAGPPPAGPGDDPASRTTPAVSEEFPGQAGRASSIRPPDALARPAGTITITPVPARTARPVRADDTGSGEARREGPSRRQPLPDEGPGCGHHIPPRDARPGPAHARKGRLDWRRFLAGRWPLAIMLAGQAALSLRLVWSNTAYPDEALYIEGGHLEWSHWLHGAPIPNFPAYFSGAPVVYPPLGALADSVGGLAGARILSLFFMLGTTALGYSLTRRLWGRTAAIFAAGLFASLGSTQYLGAFATYDAMALFLLATATWLCVRAADTSDGHEVLLLAGAGVTLALANASKYATGLFDPVVILVGMLATMRAKNRKDGTAAGLIAASVAALCILIAVTLGGTPYRQGIAFTTLARATGTSPAFAVWYLSAGWVGIVAGLGVAGALAATFRCKARSLRAIAWVLAGAALLVPAEQARIHVITSLFKHDDFGAWLAVPVAGYALASFPQVIAKGKVRAALALGGALAVLSAALGLSLSWNQFHTWPSATTMLARARPILDATTGPVLAGDNGYDALYYLGGDGHHQFWGAGFAAYSALQKNERSADLASNAALIKHKFFKVIILSFHQNTWIDQITREDIAKYGGYREAASLPYAIGYSGLGHGPVVRGSWEIWVVK